MKATSAAVVVCGLLQLVSSVSIPSRGALSGRTSRGALNGCMRLRGGQALTRDEITEKMNSIPTFYIVGEDGGMVGLRDKEGKTAICWFTDAAEARVILGLSTLFMSTTLASLKPPHAQRWNQDHI